MFSFFKRSKPVSTLKDLSAIGCDMHSHLVPGVDDGAPDIETSMLLVKGLIDLGYRKIITTPHIMQDLYKNDRSTILEPFHYLKYELKKEGIDIEIHAAAEYFLDDHFDTLLEMDNELLTLKENLVLIEFSFVSLPIDYKQKIFSIQIKNYHPVLAHPERYLYMHRNRQLYHELKDLGCLLQINLLSLAGYYGKSVQDAAQYLIRENLVDLVGTDMHHERHLRKLQDPEWYPSLQRLLDSGRLLNPTF